MWQPENPIFVKRFGRPDLPVTLFTDQNTSTGSWFDETRILKNGAYSFIDKIQSLMQSPYRQTIFLELYKARNFGLKNLFRGEIAILSIFSLVYSRVEIGVTTRRPPVRA